jgi:hypothetical protein
MFIQYFIKKYEKAKIDEDDEFLLAVKKVHRKARIVLDEPGVKAKIQSFIDNKIVANRRKSFFKAYYALAKFFEGYGFEDPVGAVFSRALAEISTASNFRALMPAGQVNASPTHTLASDLVSSPTHDTPTSDNKL